MVTPKHTSLDSGSTYLLRGFQVDGWEAKRKTIHPHLPGKKKKKKKSVKTQNPNTWKHVKNV